jgi:methylthioribose-1-phosphate isomerase
LKLLPPDLEALGFVIRDDPPDDVWETAPEGVNVRNPLFECVPHRLLSGLLLDENYVTPDALLDLLPEIPVSSLW